MATKTTKPALRVKYVTATTLAALEKKVTVALRLGAEMCGTMERQWVNNSGKMMLIQPVLFGRSSKIAADFAELLAAARKEFPGLLPAPAPALILRPPLAPLPGTFHPYPKGFKAKLRAMKVKAAKAPGFSPRTHR